jgi:hypothetical protein
MDITGLIISWEACLSVRVLGFTADTMAADTTDAVIMAGATMAVITAEVTEAMAAVIMDVAGMKDTKAAGATTVVVIKAAEITATAATREAGIRVVETAATAVVEIAFMEEAVNHMAADTVAVGTGKSK